MRATFEALPLDKGSSFRFFEIDQSGGFDGHWHYHPELELKWVLDGVGQRMVGDHMEAFGPSDLILVGSNLSHCWRTAPDFTASSRAYVLQFPRQVISGRPELRAIEKMLGESSRGLSFHISGKETGRRLELAFDRLRGAKAGTWESYAFWLSLLGELTELPRTLLASEEFSPREPQDDRLAKVIDLIFESAERPMEEGLFAEACKLASMTPSAFSRFFKRHTGRTFSRFLNQARISRASRLLVESEQNVLAISLECGFGSLSHFNRVFAELKGDSPGQWRRKFRAA